MKTRDSKKAILKRLENSTDKTVAGAVHVMVTFYAEERATDCPVDEDADMLLYQWGTYDWGSGEHFELNLTRQFILSGEDEPYQLRMTLLFEPTDDCRQLGDSNRWCGSPAHLPQFVDYIHQSAPYVLLNSRVPPEIAVDYSQV